MKRNLTTIILATTSALAATTAAAHHGAAPYDSTSTKTVIGIVTDFRFSNPHVLIYIDVSQDNGETVNWSGELTSPNRLARAAGGTNGNVNWSKDILLPGDVIELTGNPARNGALSLRLRQVIDAKGVTLVGGNSGATTTTPAARFASESIAASADGVGDLSGVWNRADNEPYAGYAFSAELPPMTLCTNASLQAHRVSRVRTNPVRA